MRRAALAGLLIAIFTATVFVVNVASAQAPAVYPSWPMLPTGSTVYTGPASPVGGVAPWGSNQVATGFAPYRPVSPDPFGPYTLIGGYARAALTAPQPTGHEILPLGPNGYTYRPTYAGGVPVSANPTAAAYGISGIGPLPMSSVPGSALPAFTPQAPGAVDRVVAEFRAGNYQAALTEVNQWLAAEPNNGAAQQWAMHCHFALRRYDAAADALRRMVRLLPSESWTEVLNRYRDYYVSSRYTEHLAALEQWVQEHPNDEPARLLLAYHAGALGMREQAMRHLQQAAQLAPGDETVGLLLARWGAQPAGNATAPVTPSAIPRGPVGPVVF
ncbi:MAG: tetratricopeptide repeat protein [Planctomycetes bacterium]|nr:tetratricopeptide repeat protein [Planctomycetota bacterium]